MQHKFKKISYNTTYWSDDMEKKRIVFMGTPKIASIVLESMLENDIEVGLVVSQPDKKKGRKQVVVYSETKEVALKHDIEVFQPIKIREDYQKLIDYKPDLIVTCAYGQIVPKVILDLPKYGCVNLHGSLLPKYRGGAPIQRAIWNGDKVSGMSLMKMAPKMDAGPVLAQKEIVIEDEDNSTSLFEKMAICASELLLENFDLICSEDAKYIEQDESKMVLAPVLSKEEEHIDFKQDDIYILNQIRAFSDAPGAYVLIKNKKFKILKAHLEQGKSSSYILETIGKNQLGFGLKSSTLVIDVCQMEGKPIMDVKSFYNGQGRNLVGIKVE